MEKEFELNLVNRGFNYEKCQTAGYYTIIKKNRIQPPISVQLVVSRPINQIIHGSQNGNELDGIGYFHFSLNSEQSPDLLVFAFKHSRNGTSQYIIIPTKELRRRLKKNIIRYRSGEHIELRLWLMDDHIYDTTSMGLEGEYYNLSKGKRGRMIDETFGITRASGTSGS